MTTLTIKLTKKQKEALDAELKQTGCSTADEYFVELMRAAAKKRARERIEQLLAEAEDEGPSTEMPKDEFKQIWREIEADLKKQKKQNRAKPRSS